MSIRIIQLLIGCLLVAPNTSTANNDVSSNSSKNVASQRSMSSKSAKKDSVQASTSSFNFRKTSWGMTPAEVRASETATYLGYDKREGEGLMVFSGQVVGMNARIYCQFVNDKLVVGLYNFHEKHSNSNMYLDDFSKVKEILENKYGIPQKDITNWSADLYKDNPQHWGLAVIMGDMTRAAQWKTASTTISLALSGDNLKASFTAAFYQSEYFNSLGKQKADSSEF